MLKEPVSIPGRLPDSCLFMASEALYPTESCGKIIWCMSFFKHGLFVIQGGTKVGLLPHIEPAHMFQPGSVTGAGVLDAAD